MKWIWSRSWFRRALALTLILVVALLACWRWRIWSPQDFREYLEVSQYPVGEDLWFGRIRPGQSVQEVVELAPPHRTQQFGRFTCLLYYPGGPPGPGELPFASLEVVAKDGRLVRASTGSCTWCRFFFDMCAADAADYDAGVRLWCQEFEKRLQ